MTEDKNDYISSPSYLELIAIIIAGAAHVGTELILNEAAASLYNITVSIIFLIYVIWRLAHTKNVYRVWGMRLDNFWKALKAQLFFAVPAVICMLGYGLAFDSLRFPATFWLTLALYPVWGIVQQFALQNFIARNLSVVIRQTALLALVAALLFSVSHYPRLPLVGLTMVAGFCLTMIYRRQPNLWAVGISHGVLGSLAVYIVLEEDPGLLILKFFGFGQ